jgi:hypothetical protein
LGPFELNLVTTSLDAGLVKDSYHFATAASDHHHTVQTSHQLFKQLEVECEVSLEYFTVCLFACLFTAATPLPAPSSSLVSLSIVSQSLPSSAVLLSSSSVYILKDGPILVLSWKNRPQWCL